MDTLTRMRAFIDVVEAEGFSAAARKIGRSKALLSKYVRELEDELGALLLNRTTRQFSMTEAGHTYFARATEIIREVDSLQEAVRDTSGGIGGRIKVSASRSFADAPIGRSLIDFALAHPDIVLDIRLDDRFVDLVEEGFDVAIRLSRLEDSSMIAKKLAPFSSILCASPALLERTGVPTQPRDLINFPCIIDTNARALGNWPFINANGDPVSVSVSGPIEVNSPLAARSAAIAGLGYVYLPDFIAYPAIEKGVLISVLDEFIQTNAAIYAVYPHRRYLPAKIRTFVDYLAHWFKNKSIAHCPEGL